MFAPTPALCQIYLRGDRSYTKRQSFNFKIYQGVDQKSAKKFKRVLLFAFPRQIMEMIESLFEEFLQLSTNTFSANY